MSKKGLGASASIDIIGADANNLKTVDVAFPLNRISVVTGVSGSGKSSLLSDTLAAEGSRRTRIFLGTSQQELEHEDVRAFIGPLPPTILVGQRGFRPSIRTTIGTATGFLAVLRRLFLLASVPYSERAGEEVPAPSPDSYAGWISKHYRGSAEIWAVPIRQQRTDGVGAVKRLASYGIEQIIIRSETDPPRLRESGRAVNASEFKGLNATTVHTIEALVGEIEVKGTSQTRQLRELLERAFAAGNGLVVVTLPAADDPDLAGPFGPRLDSTKHRVHPDAREVFARPSVHLLSFNAPDHEDSGACRSCGGTGMGRRFLESVLVSHPERSMRDGAFAIWTEKNYKYVNIQHETIEGLRGMHGFSPEVPWSELPISARELVLNGAGDELVFDREPSGRKFGIARPFAGFRKIILDKSAAGTKSAEQLGAFVATGPCDSCGGSRWSFQARALRVGGISIDRILEMTFTNVESFAAARGDFASAVPSAMRSLVEAIRRHAHSIGSVGLGYLSGDRGMLEVSEGESRRIRLARVLDASESGFCFLLDEPARGLHESDISELASALTRLRGKHTVILNEHRERLWDVADWFVEVGPQAGSAGGNITHAGTRRDREAKDKAPLRQPLPIPAKHPRLAIRGASIHNVRNVDCEIPLGRLTCISGVSGSGKSSFIRGVLAPALAKSAGGIAEDFALKEGQWRSVSGTSSISEVVAIDQTMPPSNRRSLVATFTGVFDGIRKTFGSSLAARRDGLSPSDFGVNAGEGRCQVCAGVGEISDSHFWSVCPACGGSRYGHRALSVRVDGMNVHELLQMAADQLGTVAETFSIPRPLIEAMSDLGVGHVAFGRRLDTLSGGEVQRLRLAMRLGAVSSGSMFFILDEPAAGLHPQDIRRLAHALNRVLDNGRNTIVIVEHNPDLIRSADWSLDFGPGSGPKGGEIVFAGLPIELAQTATPTGRALAGKLPRPKSSSAESQTAPPKETITLDEQVARTTALVRTLLSGDAAAAPTSETGSAEPIVILSERLSSGRNDWEVVGLDLEIPKLLLDVHRGEIDHGFEGLLDEWRKDPDCWLALQPFITDMQVWETELPRSAIDAVVLHLSKEGLRLVTAGGSAIKRDFDVRQVRATGDRLVPVAANDEARVRALRDAFAVGAGYVELRDPGGRLRAKASNRLLNLDEGLIAPMALVPSQFSRLDPQGRCPMCLGSRGVTAIAEALVIGNEGATPDSERFLTVEANAILKGVRRNDLNPFLRRLAKEGLWDLETSFKRLDREKRDLILFGFWSRPGAGSFLKTSQSSPFEVSSWLRWDGLYCHILAQAARSRDAEWVRRLRESAHTIPCVRCGGSGLQHFASLLSIDDAPFSKWVRLSDTGRMLSLLSKVKPLTPRQQRTRERILHCLAPIANSRTSTLSVIERAVKSFTTMETANSGDLGES